MKYTLKIFFVMFVTAVLLTGIIWLFSSAERQFALSQYLEINKTSANSIQYELQDNIGKWTDEEGHVDYEGLLNSLPKHDFHSVSILNKNGTIVVSTDSAIQGAFINTLGDGGKEAFFNPNGANFMFNGDAYYFAKVISDDYRVMGIIQEGELVVTKTKISLLNVVESVVIVAIIMLSLTLLIMFYKQRFNVLYKVKPVNNYTLATTKNGSILYADKNFNNTFGHVKFRECFLNENKTFQDALTSGNLLLFALKNKEDQVKKVAFNATRGLGEYKLVGSDVTSFMNKHEELLNEFETDSQTGLKNIHPFNKEWEEYVDSDFYQDGLVCFLGIPNMDYYRTLYGEENFSKGLRFVCNMIENHLKDYGNLFAAKGNVFLFVKTKEQREKFLNNVKKIQEKLSETISVYGNLIKLDIRMGVVLLAELKKDTDVEYVFNAGMRALKSAKDLENPPYYYIQKHTTFDISNYQLVTHQLINELIAKGAIDVYFQPQIKIKTERVVGFEALFRFSDPKIKNINIFDFIASAERHGCIIELGEFIYKRAMDFACLVQKYNIAVSINISPIQLMQMGFIEKFLQEYKKRNLKPGIIHVEIVEGTMIYSVNDVIQKLELLKANGIYAEIDDFGIAYSSMLYLKKLPITTIKIDKAFIDNIETSPKDRDLIKNIINITKDFGLTCIAEGVERQGQKDILKQLGCDIIQGYYYSQAIPKEKVFQYIKKMNKDVGEKLWYKHFYLTCWQAVKVCRLIMALTYFLQYWQSQYCLDFVFCLFLE